MSNSSYKQEQTDLRIIGNTGDVIAAKENNQCMSINNLSMSCRISEKNDDLIILLTLINITANNTGNYTAWFKEDLHIETKTTPLIVIDKPQIMEFWKPVLHQSFSVMCATSYTSDCITYYWKINGSDLQDSKNIHARTSTLTYRNVTMMDNYSMLTCRAGIEKCNYSQCNSFEYSDPYTVESYYGPMYVSLTLNESLVYLEENTTFKVKCLASCFPACAFRWESFYINVDNEELVINSFNERLSGVYTCTATNRETGVTAKSSPIFLHLAKVSLAPGERQGLRPEQYWMGAITVCVFLLMVGFVFFIIHWRKRASREIVADSKRSSNKDSKERASASKSNLGGLSVYDDARDNVFNGNSQDTGHNTEHSLYDYASPIETCRVEVADIHVTFENYITPVHDPISPTEMCASGDINLLGSDRIDITTSSEPVHSINDIKVHDSELSYITPII